MNKIKQAIKDFFTGVRTGDPPALFTALCIVALIAAIIYWTVFKGW
jgi:hypothetical protein